MTGNKLLTREDLLKDIFNNSKIETRDVKKFLLYFGAILQLGISEGLIDEAGRNFIANAITNAIEIKTSEEDDEDENYTNYYQIRNYMYIVSSYLQSKTNWNAWLELISIKRVEDAFVLIDNAKKWFEGKLIDCKKLLADTKLYVVKSNLKNLTEAYQILLFTLKDTVACTSSITKFDLQDNHATAICTGMYILIGGDELPEEENFVEKLCNTIHSFCMEVSILFKVNAKEFFKSKKEEVELSCSNSYKKVVEVDLMYKEKLATLNNEYRTKLKNCDDEIELEREYSDKKYYLEEEWQKTVNKIEEGVREEVLQIEILGDDYSLYDFILEYAIYQMALKGDIFYPSTMEERGSILLTIDRKKAIEEFISGTEQQLTSKQIDFLKKCM